MKKLPKILLVILITVGALLEPPAVHASHMRTPINWRKSSETVPYPNLATVPNLWIKVRLKHNRTYVYSGKRWSTQCIAPPASLKRTRLAEKIKV